MSVVSGIVLTVGVMDAPLPDAIFQWFAERRLSPLADLTSHTSGNKHPQISIFGAGFNYFPEDEFAIFILDQPWVDPESVVLLIHPEEGRTRIWRPAS